MMEHAYAVNKTKNGLIKNKLNAFLESLIQNVRSLLLKAFAQNASWISYLTNKNNVFQQSTRKFDVLDKICRKVPLKLAFYG